MPATPDDLFAYLDRLGIAHQTVSHPAVFTVEQARELRGSIPGGHTKNLFLKDKRGTLFLLSAGEDAVIDLKTLHHRLDAARFSFGSADLLREAWGVEPGSVTPFGALNDVSNRVEVVLQAELMRHGILNFHPLNNTMTTSISPEGLMRFLEGTGHTPRILSLAGEVEATPLDGS
jgi:Ala-tRNA(Pro) deacylase